VWLSGRTFAWHTQGPGFNGKKKGGKEGEKEGEGEGRREPKEMKYSDF
jgi:hypothetical protein